MSTITLDLDEKTAKLVERLADDLKVGDAASLIRRALAIAALASETAGDQKILTMIDHQNQTKRVHLAA